MEGETVFQDEVRGEVRWQNAIIDDLVVCRSDGSPTYNFCVVVDDADMEITHVIRGEDHISNTPRQVQIYEALGLPLPKFAHLPLVKGLSKRKGSAAVGVYREKGYLPAAVVNFLARLGWSHGDQEIFSMAELKEHFTISGVGKASGEYNETKLEWTNGQHIHAAEPADLIPYLAPLMPGVDADNPRLVVAVGQLRERAKTLLDFVEKGRCYFERVEPDEKAKKQLAKADPAVLTEVIRVLKAVEPWEQDSIEAAYKSVAETLEVGLGKVAQPVRSALTGTTAHVGIWEFTSALDREEIVARLEAV
jgi:glutamyl-tRNA synthetase